MALRERRLREVVLQLLQHGLLRLRTRPLRNELLPLLLMPLLLRLLLLMVFM